MHHKKSVAESSATLSKGVLFLLLFSVGSTLFFSTYFVLKRSRLKTLHAKKILIKKKYKQAQQNQKNGMLAVFMASELKGWKTSAITIFNHLDSFSKLPSDLKLSSYVAESSFAYRMLPKENQTEFFKHAFMLTQTASAALVDSGTKKGKYAFPKFLDQMNLKLKTPFETDSQEVQEEESIPFEGWFISIEEKKEWAWKSVLKTSNSDL
jgi:hypothetical protein